MLQAHKLGAQWAALVMSLITTASRETKPNLCETLQGLSTRTVRSVSITYLGPARSFSNMCGYK